MSQAWASIIVALIGLLGSVLMFFLNKFRKENRDDHNHVTTLLGHLHEDVKKVDEKLSNHIDWHLKK